MKGIRIPIPKISGKDFEAKLHALGVSVLPFSLLIPNGHLLFADCDSFLEEVKTEQLNTPLGIVKVRKLDDEYYYFGNGVAVFTKVK